MTKQEIIDAAKRLAGLLGWTNVAEVNGALVGTPPPGEPECRGQAQVPDWCGDWSAAGPLIAAHGLLVEPMHVVRTFLAKFEKAPRQRAPVLAKPIARPETPGRQVHIIADDSHYPVRETRVTVRRDPLVEALFGFAPVRRS